MLLQVLDSIEFELSVRQLPPSVGLEAVKILKVNSV